MCRLCTRYVEYRSNVKTEAICDRWLKNAPRSQNTDLHVQLYIRLIAQIKLFSLKYFSRTQSCQKSDLPVKNDDCKVVTCVQLAVKLQDGEFFYLATSTANFVLFSWFRNHCSWKEGILEFSLSINWSPDENASSVLRRLPSLLKKRTYAEWRYLTSVDLNHSYEQLDGYSWNN